MKTQAKGKFEVKSWDEKTWDGQPWNEVQGAKLTQANVTKVFTGDIEGEATLRQLSAYNEDGSATFFGLEQIIGSISGKKGSFVAQSSGTYDPKTGSVDIKWSVVPGSGTEELKGLCGEGNYIAKHEDYPYVTIELEYFFDKEIVKSFTS